MIAGVTAMDSYNRASLLDAIGRRNAEILVTLEPGYTEGVKSMPDFWRDPVLFSCEGSNMKVQSSWATHESCTIYWT